MNTPQRFILLPLAGLIAVLGTSAGKAAVDLDTIAGFEVGFSGLIQYDFNRFDIDEIDYRDDEGLRRTELKLGGKRGDVSWKIGYDTTGEKYLDNNISFRAGIAKITLGQFKQPNGLEELSSTKNNDFISKAMATNAFAMSRRLGGSAMLGGDRWTVTASLFDGELTAGSDAGSGAGTRVTYAPVYGDDRLLHLGLSAVQSDLPGNTTRIRVRPNADLAGIRPVDTAPIAGADEQQTVGAEGIWAHGPLKVQAEYLKSDIGRNGNREDFNSDAWYVSSVWNLSGESWSYRSGVIGTAKPNRPSTGMWQAGLRYDRIDLDDREVSGGTMRGLTLGVNYYWRANFKLAANWVRIESRRAGQVDEPDILELRAQFHW